MMEPLEGTVLSMACQSVTVSPPIPTSDLWYDLWQVTKGPRDAYRCPSLT